MILGFDFLGFQAIKRFPTKNRIFLHVMQCTITKNSIILVFYSYVLVFYPYVAGMLLVCTRMYSYVLVCYSYVLVWCFSHDRIKTTSYAHKTTSYAHKTTSYAHKTTSYGVWVIVECRG